MRIVCRSCLSLLGREVEVYTIGITGPKRCEVCGTIADKQGEDFDAVRNEYAEEAHRLLADALRTISDLLGAGP